jgi:hypothetical protein
MKMGLQLFGTAIDIVSSFIQDAAGPSVATWGGWLVVPQLCLLVNHRKWLEKNG